MEGRVSERNYIDRVALAIARACDDTDADPDLSLYRIYAVLALTLGPATSNKAVHDAWSAWQAARKPDHRSLIPFDELSVAVQELDTPYRDAIIHVAQELACA